MKFPHSRISTSSLSITSSSRRWVDQFTTQPIRIAHAWTPWTKMNTTLQPRVPVFDGCQRSIPQSPILTLAAEALKDDSPPSSAGSAKSAILGYETDEAAYILEEEEIRLQSESTVLSRAHHFPLAKHRSAADTAPKAWNSSQTFPPRGDDSKASARRKHPSGPHANCSHFRYMPRSIFRMCRRFRGWSCRPRRPIRAWSHRRRQMRQTSN